MKNPQIPVGKLGWGRRRIKHQLILVCVVAFLPMLLIGLYLISSAGNMMRTHYLDLLTADNRQVKLLLSQVGRTAYMAADEMCMDETVRRLLSTTYETEGEFLASANKLTLLDTLVYQNREFERVVLYTDNPTIRNYKQFRTVGEEVRQSDWYTRASTRYGAFWASIDNGSAAPGRNSNLSLVRSVALPGSDYSAVLVLTLSDSYIRSVVDYDNSLDIIFTEDGTVAYSTKSSLYRAQSPLEVGYDTTYYRYAGMVELDGEDCYAVVSTVRMYMTNSRVFVGSMDREGVEYARRLDSMWTLILFLCVVIPGGILIAFVRYFARRVDLLRGEMHKASSQDYDIIPEFQGHDELTDAFEDLRRMVADIKEKDAKMFEAELNEKELRNRQQLMEYKMLAAQINPHFLYNTLETIRMKALTHGVRDVADAIKILGKTLHYVFENTGNAMTVLQKELTHVENYLSIQKLRFGERINYQIIVEPGVDAQHYPILPLLVQPVVENAVVHGLENVRGTGLLTIRVGYLENGNLAIRVADNGVGMDEAALETVRSKLSDTAQMPHESVALYNISQRIRLCYGEGYGLTIQSQVGQGTQVCLELPGTFEEGA